MPLLVIATVAEDAALSSLTFALDADVLAAVAELDAVVALAAALSSLTLSLIHI